MSFIVGASGEKLVRTTDLPAADLFTIAGWARITERPNNWQYWGVESAGASPGSFLQMGIAQTGVLQLSSHGSTNDLGEWGVDSGIPSDGEWFYWVLQCVGSSEGDFLGSVKLPGQSSVGTSGNPGSGFTTGQMTLGNNGWDEWADAWEGAYTKVWDANLSAAELAQEIWSAKPVRTADLHIWSPHFPGSGERNLDYSGNGRDWTEAGSPADGDQPPVSWGASVLEILPVSGGIALG